MKKKKSNALVATIIIIIGIISIAAVFFIAYNLNAKADHSFNPDKANAAAKLYKKVTTYNFDTDYPKTADEVMELNNDIYLLLYGNMLVNEDKIPEILTVQRKLFSEELLSKNSFDAQEKSIIEDLSVLKAADNYIISISKELPIYDPYDQTTCTIKTSQYTNKLESFNFEYSLVKDSSDLWKISAWHVVK